MLTRKFSEALKFMGYPASGLDTGFDTKTDIFQFVASSPYFNRAIYLLENRNAKSRVRDKKREMYMQFLLWCEAQKGLTAYKYPENKDTWLTRVAEHFETFQTAFYRAGADLAELREVKEKFNGEVVAKLTGLEGKELGTLMKRFKESFDTPEKLRSFVLESSPAVIEARVRQLQGELAS